MTQLFYRGDLIMGRYSVQSLLEEDTTEERYLAEHHELGHLVDVRCFTGAADSTQLARFERSARMMARVRDPRVVSLLDYGVEQRQPVVVLEHVEGQTVRSALDASGPVAWPQALEITESLLLAVGTLHAAQVLHRHVRPASIYLVASEANAVKLSDLGLAKPAWQQDSKITAVGKVVGTPIYMSPEQLDLQPPDERSDLYAVALVLFELLTGTIPEGSRTRLALARRLVSEPVAPEAPRGLPPIPPAVQRTVVRGLARDPDGRFQTAEEFRVALERVRRSSGQKDPDANRVIPLWRTTEAPPRRTKVLRLQLTTAERGGRSSHSARASAFRPEFAGQPVRALVACRVGHDTDSTMRGHVELLLGQFGDSYRVSDTAWIGAVRADSPVVAKEKSHNLCQALNDTIAGRGAVVAECTGQVIDVPSATLAGLAPPTVEMMRLLDQAAAQLRQRQ